MKLLVCASEYYPHGSGIANVVYNVVKVLKQNGVDCTVCSPNGPDIQLGSHSLIQKMGIIGLLYFWYQVSRFFKKNNYDAVWLHNPFFTISNPFHHSLVTIHTTYYGESLFQVGSSAYLRIYKKLVALIERNCLLRMKSSTIFSGVGQPVCSELSEIGIDKDRIIYIPNGVDIKKFHPSENKNIIRKKFGIPEEDVILLSVGRLTPQKQPHMMLEVFSVLEKQLDKIMLCIAGKGELLDSTQRLAKKMGIQKIKFLGHVDNQELPDLYACSDYFIMTSKYEGTPLTLLEAMSTGLPCIVSDIPNLEMVQDADCGIVVRFSEIQKAADEILNYLKSGHSDHAKTARMYTLTNLDWEIISEQYLKVFSDISKLYKNQIQH
jgi:glycosyltransferase involved in cell wall biosynthesis